MAYVSNNVYDGIRVMSKDKSRKHIENMKQQISIKDIVKDNNAHFESYRNGYFHYVTDGGFEFRIPLDDVDGVTLNKEDKAIFFMRWIKKELAGIAQG